MTPRARGGVFAAGALISAGAAAWLLSKLEVGSRPTESSAPLPAPPDVNFIEANGIRFGYIEKGAGPLILLFHGYPETARSWAPVQDRLATAGYRAVAPYLRGYPPSSASANGDYAVKTLGKDVLALIDAFGAESEIVVGHDWGASAVYAAAIESPARIKALAALSLPHALGIAGDPRVLWKADHFLYYQLPWARRIVWSHNFAHIDRIYRLWAPNFHPSKAQMEDIKSTLSVPGAVDAALGYYWSAFKTGPSAGGSPAISSIATPALVIAGSADGGIAVARFAKARPAFTGPYTFVELAGVGHLIQMEAPDKVADAILAFLKNLGL